MFTTDFLGWTLENPLMLTEGPLSGNGTLVRKAVEGGAGLVFTKGIRPEPISSPVPYMGIYDGSLMNADWSCIGLSAWEEEFRRMDGELPVVASIAKNYVTPQTAVDMAVRMEKAGAGIISFVDYNPAELIETIRLARPLFKIPLMVKLPPFLPRLEEVLKELVTAGIDAIAAMDSIGPVLTIDVETGAPLLGSSDGGGYLSGHDILPVTLKYIYDIAGFVDIPVVGVGGVTDGKSAVQMMMAGASGVGMVTRPLYTGVSVFGEVLEEIRIFMERKGYSGPDAIRDLTRRVNQGRQVSEEFRAVIDQELCIGCGKCAKICYSGAVSQIETVYRVDPGRCTGCGLCAGVCPVDAIRYLQIR